MSETPTEGPRLKGGAKLAVDMGPLAVFMIAYFFGGKLVSLAGTLTGNEWCLREGSEMYLAIAGFMPAFAVAFAYSAWKEKRIAPMLLVSAVIIGVLGTLTLVLHNKTFFYMKPTLVYLLFASVLYGGMRVGRNFLKTLFDGALHLPEPVWRTLTVRFSIFFVALAIVNEIAWRWLTGDCPTTTAPVAETGGAWGWLLRECGGAELAKCDGEAAWVQLKVFGFTLASLVFTGLQAPLISKYIEEEGTNEPGQS